MDKVTILIIGIGLAIGAFLVQYIRASIRSGKFAKLKNKINEISNEERKIEEKNSNTPLSDLVSRNNRRIKRHRNKQKRRR